jgi:hypothetical protein
MENQQAGAQEKEHAALETRSAASAPPRFDCASWGRACFVTPSHALSSLFDAGTYWIAREPCDEAPMAPNFYVAIICPQHCLLDRLFVVDTFRNLGNAKKIAIEAGSVEVIYPHRKFPGANSRGCNGQPMCGCRAGVEISGALTAPLMR